MRDKFFNGLTWGFIMAVFCLVMDDIVVKYDDIPNLLHNAFGPENVRTVSHDKFFIHSNDIVYPKALADKLGNDFNNGKYGTFILMPINSYWGFHDKDNWSWLAEKGVQ